MAEAPTRMSTEHTGERRRQRLLFLLAMVCSLFIAFFRLNDEWLRWDEWLGVNPPWFSRSVGLATVTFLVYGIVYIMTAIAWIGVTVGVLKQRPGTQELVEALQQVVVTVLLVLAILVLFW